MSALCQFQNRRKKPRMKPHQLYATLRVNSEENGYRTCPVFDISFDGLAVCSPTYIWPGSRLNLRLTDSEGHVSHEVDGIVRRAARCHGQNCYNIGVEITIHRGNCREWFASLSEECRARTTSCPLSCSDRGQSCIEQIERMNRK